MSRITPGTLIILILAVLFGLVGAYAVRRALEPPPVAKVEPPKPEPPELIPVAAIDLVPGRPLANSDFGVIEFTAKDKAARKLPSFYLKNAGQYIGRILRVSVRHGEVFAPDMFYPEGTGPTLAERLGPDRMAMSVAVQGGALNGLAVPGSKVDVLFRTSPSATRLPPSTITLIQDVELLAIGQNTVPGAKNNEKELRDQNIVTLAVTSEEANRLKIVEGRGELSLVLHGDKNAPAPDAIYPQTLEQLLNIPPRLLPFTAEIYRRGSRQTVTFQNNQVIKEEFGDLKIAPPRRSQVAPPNAAPPAPANPPANNDNNNSNNNGDGPKSSLVPSGFPVVNLLGIPQS